MIRAAIGALVVGLVIGGGIAVWVSAGRAEGPALAIMQPAAYIGRTASFVATADAPGAEFTALAAYVEQNGTVHPLFSLDAAAAAAQAAVDMETETRLRISRTFGRDTHPDLVPGPARVVVTATRPVLYGLRERTSEVSVDVTVRFDPPRLTPVSTFHYVTHGGSELVVYRVTPDDAESGVRVGGREYAGYPLSAAGVDGSDDLRVAFFALLHDQDLATPIELWGRDPAGNEAAAPFDLPHLPARVSARTPVGRGRVPAARRPPARRGGAGTGRRGGGCRLRAVRPARPVPVHQPGTAPAEPRDARRARRTDRAAPPLGRTVPPTGKLAGRVGIRRSPHLSLRRRGGGSAGASRLRPRLDGECAGPRRQRRRRHPCRATSAIFGNCVVIDHGLGLQSLYAHLSSMDVAVGDEVAQDQPIGLTGQTGLAGGDHLHFAMLLQGRPVTPMEWWDPQWIEDRIVRKLREAERLPARRMTWMDR